MKPENQVCTMEQAKRLKELGVAQNIAAYFYHHNSTIPEGLRLEHPLVPRDGCGPSCKCKERHVGDAFTVAELGVMLPRYLEQGHALATYFHEDRETLTVHTQYFEEQGDCQPYMSNYPGMELPTEAQSRAALLIHVLENGLTTAEEVNARLAAA